MKRRVRCDLNLILYRIGSLDPRPTCDVAAKTCSRQRNKPRSLAHTAATPAAQPGQRAVYRPQALHEPQPGQRIGVLSDDFRGSRLSSLRSWIREPATDSYSVGGGSLR